MDIKVKDIEFKSAEHVIEEIRGMNVKGGSPFGRSAAWAFKLSCEQEKLDSKEELHERIKDLTTQMISLKPTMATIRNSCSIVEEVFQENSEASVNDLKKKIIHVCDNIISNSLAAVDSLAKIGANLIQDEDTIMMHSYSSTLMGIYIEAAKQGKKFTVICTESRPLRESRLAVHFLQELEENVIYITDAEAFEFMPKADFIITGADSLCSNGSAANKIGTATLAQLAKFCKKPFYIASELYKYNAETKNGKPIILERRTETEMVTEGDFDSHKNLQVINQFFDLTPACNITGLICEFGLINSGNVDYYWGQLKSKLKEGI